MMSQRSFVPVLSVRMFEDREHQQTEADQRNQGHSEEEERLVRER